MSWRAFYSAVVLLGFVSEICLLAILILRRQYRIFPVFTLYIAFNLLSDIVRRVCDIPLFDACRGLFAAGIAAAHVSA